ncbi:MAG: isopenicillin N synthase family dioxygenase [Thiolinea sp.]
MTQTLTPVDYQDTNAAAKFVHSLRDTGFAVLKNHPLSSDQITNIYQHWQQFFNSADKEKYRYNIDTQDGFFPPDISETAKGHQIKDIKEYFHFYHPWGQCPEHLREELAAYRTQANELATELLSWVEAHSPAEVSALYSEPLSAMIKDSGQTLLRVLHYPPISGEIPEGAMRAAAHEDINLLTILPAANEPGLQVKSRDGTWIDAPCDYGLVIVNTGDMLQEASGGYFPSTTHRVINPPAENCRQSRISLPLFLHPRPEVVLSRRHTARSYLKERLQELRGEG